jgi:hypothetical protein
MHFYSRAACALVAALCLASSSAPAVSATTPSPVRIDADRFLQQYELITLDPTEALRQVRGTGRVTIAAGLERFDVQLEARDLRAPGYRAVETLAGGEERVLPAAPSKTYAGRVEGRDNVTARFTIDEGRVSGLILDGDDPVFVEPLATFSLAGGPTDYVVYRASGIRPEAEPGTCGISEAEKLDAAIDGVAGKAAEAAATGPSIVQLATEADNEFVSLFGSSQAANDEILTVVNQVDGVYEAEVGLSFQVSYQGTYAAGADPYSATTNASSLLSEFRTYWNANRGSVSRDVTHMWTGKDMDGSTIGIAYVGVVCNASTYSYGISQRYSPTPQKYVLTAHELGHNFNACHSDTSCNPNTSSCSSTIMQSFVGTGFTFCSFSRGQITTHATTYASCLTPTTTTPPAPPLGLLASATSASRVDLTWTHATADETGFKIERSAGAPGAWSQIATAGAGASSFADTTAASSTTYYYRVRAYNGAGDSAYSNEASATTPASLVPAAPSGLTATAVSGTRIDLAWVDNSGNETGFRIERSTNGSAYTQIATVGANIRTYSNTGLRRNKTYSYRVLAYNASGNSGYSNTASARTPR